MDGDEPDFSHSLQSPYTMFGVAIQAVLPQVHKDLRLSPAAVRTLADILCLVCR
jgi:hypothetical protein